MCCGGGPGPGAAGLLRERLGRRQQREGRGAGAARSTAGAPGRSALSSSLSPAAGNGSAGQILSGHPRRSCPGVPAGRCPRPPRRARSRRPRPSAAPYGDDGGERKRRSLRFPRPVSAEQLRRRVAGRAGQSQPGPGRAARGVVQRGNPAGPQPVSTNRDCSRGKGRWLPDGLQLFVFF